ncbi:MAG TPA: lysophospholipid acyltransferase family protein [Geobacteraceae bacterium]|nr:lysophospholipid acyltransferase family protein [Geobacteraceae bacterium]
MNSIMVRASLYLLFVFPWTFICSIIALLSTFIERSGRVYHKVALFWSKVCLLAAGVKIEVDGSELIPRDQPVIFMSNHQGNFDILALFQAIPIRFNWLAKEELFKIPLFGRSMQSAGYIPINRGDGRDSLKSLDRAAMLVRGGTSIAIFPEGTRSNDGSLLPFKRGGFILATKAAVPIIPVSISGSMKINPPDNLFCILPGVIRIKFSPPVQTTLNGTKQQIPIMDQVRMAIAAGLES